MDDPVPEFVLLTGGVVHAGPPTLCHPLNIGDAASLPFGNDPFEPGKLTQPEVLGRTLEVLDSSLDATVHHETLRRAYIYLGFRKRYSAKQLGQLTSALKDRALAAEAAADSQDTRKRALCWFDLSMLHRLISEDHYTNSDRECWQEVELYMSKAVSLDPENGSLDILALSRTDRTALENLRLRLDRHW